MPLHVHAPGVLLFAILVILEGGPFWCLPVQSQTFITWKSARGCQCDIAVVLSHQGLLTWF
jgi:hypothetical protein